MSTPTTRDEATGPVVEVSHEEGGTHHDHPGEAKYIKIALILAAITAVEVAFSYWEAVEGILAPTGYSPDADYETNADFVERVAELYDRIPSEDEANAFTTGQVVQAAVEAVGCAEQGECQQELIDWLHSNTVETVVGPLGWDEAGRPDSAHFIQQYVNGELAKLAKLRQDNAAAESRHEATCISRSMELSRLAANLDARQQALQKAEGDFMQAQAAAYEELSWSDPNSPQVLQAFEELETRLGAEEELRQLKERRNPGQ